MENTSRFIFRNSAASEWFTVIDDILQGPIDSNAVIRMVEEHKLNISSFLWKKELSSWTRIFEIEEFATMLSREPAAEFLAEAQAICNRAQETPPPPAAKEPEREWFVFADEKQYGPFSNEELKELIATNRVLRATPVWKRSFSEWIQAGLTQELGILFDSAAEVAIPPPKPRAEQMSPPASPAAKGDSSTYAESRRSPRKPFEVHVLLTDGQEVGWAVCRDISLGGMQVLTNYLPGPVGTDLRINVNAHKNIPGFACTGKIMRIADDHRAFFLKFTTLPEEAKTSIAKFLIEKSEYENENP